MANKDESHQSSDLQDDMQWTDETKQPSSVRPGLKEETKWGSKDLMQDYEDKENPLNPETFAPLRSDNQFKMRKKAIEAMMDVALMMANISQFRAIVNAGPSHTQHYFPLIYLVSFSLAAQLIFALFIIIIWVREKDQSLRRQEYQKLIYEAKIESDLKEQTRLSKLDHDNEYKHQRPTNYLNIATTVLVFAITVINMFITGFGIELEAEPVKMTSS